MRKELRGFTLLEFLFAISLGAIICIGIFHIFITLHILQQRQMQLTAIQENTRFITEFMRKKIQDAGDWSCEK